MMNVSRINRLDAHVANQIAAGEVIERPASVVKELLENALDSGASIIQVDIGYGGLNRISVSDNGLGIVADDLPLALAPNATSKLVALGDLARLVTMGFRGEALASIASVARVTIQSRPAGVAHAMAIEQDGAVVRVYPCARAEGTTVDVRDLFFNAPVRKRFLKTAALEYLAIEAVVRRFAFCEPRIALTLTHNDTVRLRLPAADSDMSERKRLQKLLGKAFVDAAITLDAQRDGMQLVGWVSAPQYARSQHDRQWVYLNRRMLRDKLMLHAIKCAYEDLLLPGRYPVCLLSLRMDATQVDVNVHPTKHEVRFANPREVHDFVRIAIRERVLGQVPAVDVAATTRSMHTTALTPAAADVHTGSSFVPLNARFVLYAEDAAVYLIDLQRLRQDAMRTQLMAQARPWPSRTLLVPVLLTLPAAEWTVVRDTEVTLQAFGLNLQVLDAYRVSIRSIPRDLPELDLRGVLLRLARESSREPQAWIEAFIAGDGWDARTISPEEMAHWHAYWQRARGFCVRLDAPQCEALFCA